MQTKGTSWEAVVVVVVVVVVAAAADIPGALLASYSETAAPKSAEKAHNLLLLDRGHADVLPSAVHNETEPRAPPPRPLATVLGSTVAAESEAGPDSTAVAEADPGSMTRSAGAGPHSKVAAAAGAGPES